MVPADIVFILDSSGSVGSANFQKMLTFVKSMAQGFDIGKTGTEVGVVTYSSKPTNQFHLNKYTDKNSLLGAIQNIHYISGGTNTADAIKYAREVSFQAANGARSNAAKIAIVITDGKSQSPVSTSAEAQRLRQQGVTVFSIGVGSGPNQQELNAMATDPDNSHVFVVTNFDALKSIKGSVSQKACEGMYSSGHLVLSCLILAFVLILMLRPFIPELVMSMDLLSFEHPSVPLFC